MKRFIYISLLTLVLTGTVSCKKYLSLDPPSDLSGNNFWKTKQDVEAFTNGMYELIRKAVTRGDLTQPAGEDEFPFFIFSGDFRGAPIGYGSTIWGRTYILDMANNNLRALNPTSYWGSIWNMQRFGEWDRFYRAIAAANIAYTRIDDVSVLSEAEKKKYKAEAVFIRSFCYFLMVRQWGDVPYYTDAYHTAPLKRMPMVQVLKNCEADLRAVTNDLPWTYTDQVMVAVRAMRGGGLALRMHINMWLASFDADNSPTYYAEVDKLGDQLQNENEGAYALLPLERTGEIFKGRSKEGLFEIPQNANYGESFGWSTFYDHINYRDALPNNYPYIAYKPDFMEKIYPPGVPDKRTNLWFRQNTIYTGDVRFRMHKFLISTDPRALDGFGFDASQAVFRYPDAILLQAEALAELGNDAKAKTMLNKVRARAEAPDITLTGAELKKEIFYERCRELMGEGHYWYDVVRTRRVIDITYPFGYHMSVDQYKAGAWTWPISSTALINNPGMVLNTYWQ